ncbi:MAG: host attachment protein [Thermodesulfobacteriota bacterium]|nr:host attachment protein [Thermodesulfobacteriota bacterium]
MIECCLVVSSETHTRFFTLESAESPEVESGPNLISQGELSNTEREMPKSTLFADSKTGRGRTPKGGAVHGYDDHRTHHEEEFERFFARKIMEKTRQLARVSHNNHVVIAASARMLGFLRQEMDILHRDGLQVQQLAKNMTQFSPWEIHDRLAREQLVPPRKRPGA